MADQPTTDTRCQTCSHDEAQHIPERPTRGDVPGTMATCSVCLDKAITTERSRKPAGALFERCRHPFASMRSTTDAAVEARNALCLGIDPFAELCAVCGLRGFREEYGSSVCIQGHVAHESFRAKVEEHVFVPSGRYDLQPEDWPLVTAFEAAIVARERERYEERIDAMGKDNLWLSTEREALTFKKEEQQARIEALEAVVTAAREAVTATEGWVLNDDPSLLMATYYARMADALAALDKPVQP